MSMRIIAAPYTPFTANKKIDPAVVPDYGAFLKRDGIDGVFVNGTTGEGLSLSVSERNAMTEAWTAQRENGFAVMIHVGSTSTVESCAMADHAERMGADAIGTVPPFYGKQSTAAVIDHMRAIADAAPNTPLYYYHIPCFTYIDLPMADMVHRFLAGVPTFAGIKFTHENLMDYQACQRLADETGSFEMGFGRDEMLISGLAIGAKLTVGSTYNYMGPLVRQVIKSFEQKQVTEAQTLQHALNKLITYVKPAPMEAGKRFLALRGLDTGPTRAVYDTTLDNTMLTKALEDTINTCESAFAHEKTYAH